jgi:hypothetical protein
LELFTNNPIDVQENYEHALDLALHLTPLFSVSVNLDSLCTAHAFVPEHLSNHCQCLCRTFSEICTKFDAVPLLDPSRNRIRPDTLLQIKKTPWPESASELYRPSDRHLSETLVSTFADRGCHVVSVTDPYGLILGFLDRTPNKRT